MRLWSFRGLSYYIRGDKKLFINISVLCTLSTTEERAKLANLYKKFERRLLFSALKIVHNQAMAEDAVHNTFVSAIQHKFKVLSMDDVDFLKWSVIVIKGKCIDLMRKEKHYAAIPIDDYDEILPSSATPVDELVAQQDLYGRLKVNIASLDDVSKQILEMKYILQMSMKETAMHLGSPQHR